jgi:hypothetical protein
MGNLDTGSVHRADAGQSPGYQVDQTSRAWGLAHRRESLRHRSRPLSVPPGATCSLLTTMDVIPSSQSVPNQAASQQEREAYSRREIVLGQWSIATSQP